MIVWIFIIIVAILFLFVDITLGVIVGFVGVALFILDKVFGLSLGKVIAWDVKREMKKEGFSDEEIDDAMPKKKISEDLEILKKFAEKNKEETSKKIGKNNKEAEKGIKIAKGKTAEGLDMLKEFVERKQKEQKSE